MFASRSRAAAAAANGGGGGSIADDTRRGAKVDRVVCRGDPSLGTKQAFKIKLELSPPSATLRGKDCFERFNLVNFTCLTFSENLEKYLGQREEGYLWSNTIMQADTFQRFRLQAFRIFFLYATTFYCLNYANL